jgi:hypothetical protein
MWIVRPDMKETPMNRRSFLSGLSFCMLAFEKAGGGMNELAS